MSYYAGMNAIPSSYQGGPGGQTRGVGGIIIVENNAFLGDTIYTRGSIPLITITAQMIRAQGIDIYK